MLLGTTTLGYQKGGRFNEAIETIAGAGFDTFDMSFRVMAQVEDCIFNTDEYLNKAKELRALADRLGIVCNQCHAPFPSNAQNFGKIIRSMEISSVLGAKYIVVHPDQQKSFSTKKDELFEDNVQFFNSLVPYCQKYNLKIAVENTWSREYYDPDKSIIAPGITSRHADLTRLFDALPSEYFVACLDVGHIVLVHENITEMITALGHDRLKVVHIHDNWIRDDDHSVPLLGKIPFDEVLSALKSIDYNGDFTFEAIAFESKFPNELKPSVARFIHDVGRHLISKYEAL